MGVQPCITWTPTRNGAPKSAPTACWRRAPWPQNCQVGPKEKSPKTPAPTTGGQLGNASESPAMRGREAFIQGGVTAVAATRIES